MIVFLVAPLLIVMFEGFLFTIEIHKSILFTSLGRVTSHILLEVALWLKIFRNILDWGVTDLCPERALNKCGCHMYYWLVISSHTLKRKCENHAEKYYFSGNMALRKQEMIQTVLNKWHDAFKCLIIRNYWKGLGMKWHFFFWESLSLADAYGWNNRYVVFAK